MTRWIGNKTMEACALDDDQMLREMGCGDLIFRARRAGGFWVEGPEDQQRRLVCVVRGRFDMTGGEGFGDGLPALRSMKAFLDREAR